MSVIPTLSLHPTVSRKKIFRSIYLLFFIITLSISTTANTITTKAQNVITPAGVDDVLYVAPYRLESTYIHHWSKDQIEVSSGLLVVFKVNSSHVFPRNGAEPVLYVGNTTAQRLNSGHESGYVIALVPGLKNLDESPAWFGAAELPERVSSDMIAAQLAIAKKSGITPFDAKKVTGVTKDHIRTSDLASLLRDHAAALVAEYSPQEKALVRTWNLPETP